MAIRIVPDQNQPSAAIEISLEKPLPDYDLEEVEFPKPREVDGVLVSQGFRDLVDDARGVLIQLLDTTGLEITQLTGAICPEDESFRPGLWIVLRDPHGKSGAPLAKETLDRIRAFADQLAQRLQLV